jgi:hypothetical protein
LEKLAEIREAKCFTTEDTEEAQRARRICGKEEEGFFDSVAARPEKRDEKECAATALRMTS